MSVAEGVVQSRKKKEEEALLVELEHYIRSGGVEGPVLESCDHSDLKMLLEEARRWGRAPRAKEKKGLILVVDDAAMVRRTLSLILRKAEYEVVEAKHGREALRLLKKGRPDLVVLDQKMPVMDGIGFLEQLRAHEAYRDLPVIMCTGVSDRPLVAQCVGLGVSGYLVKPFKRERLVEKVTEVLGGKEDRREEAGGSPEKTGEIV
jgi:CheY-like chemotaxis protein